jgi:O-antigen ligase
MNSISTPNEQTIIWSKYFNLILVLISLSLATSTSLSGFFNAIFGIYCLAYLYKFKLWNKLFSEKSQLFLFLFLVVAHISHALYMHEMPRPMRGLSKLRYLWIGWLSIPVMRDLYLKKLINFRNILIALIGSYTFATVIGTITRLTGFEVFRFRYGNEHGRMPGITGIFQYAYESPWVIFMTIAALLKSNIFSTKEKNVLWLATVANILGVMLGGNRGGVVAMVTGTPFLFYVYNKKLFKITLIIGTIFTLITAYIFLGSKFSNWREQSISNHHRMELYHQSIYLIKDRPILGSGPYHVRNLGPTPFKYHPTISRNEKNEFISGDVHSTYLQVIVDMGIVGGLLYILFLISWSNNIIRSQQIFTMALLPSCIAYLSTSFFHSMFLTGTTTALLIMLMYSFSTISTKEL